MSFLIFTANAKSASEAVAENYLFDGFGRSKGCPKEKFLFFSG